MQRWHKVSYFCRGGMKMDGWTGQAALKEGGPEQDEQCTSAEY